MNSGYARGVTIVATVGCWTFQTGGYYFTVKDNSCLCCGIGERILTVYKLNERFVEIDLYCGITVCGSVRKR